MVVTLQPFLIQFTRFLSENHKKYIKNDLLSERNENKNSRPSPVQPNCTAYCRTSADSSHSSSSRISDHYVARMAGSFGFSSKNCMNLSLLCMAIC